MPVHNAWRHGSCHSNLYDTCLVELAWPAAHGCCVLAVGHWLTQDERLQEHMEMVQGRFKAVASMLGCLQKYFPKDKDVPASPGGGGGVAASALSF